MAKGGRGKGWTGAVAQQPLQCCAVVCLNAHAGIHREAAVFVGKYLFGIDLLYQGAPDEGAHDAAAQIGLRLSHCGLINPAGWVKDDSWRCGCGISINFTWHHLKHPINHANMEVHMLVQAGAEAVDEGDCADLRRTGAVGR